MSTQSQVYYSARTCTVRDGFVFLGAISVNAAGVFEIALNTAFPFEDLAPGAIGLICAELLDELVAAQAAAKKMRAAPAS